MHKFFIFILTMASLLSASEDSNLLMTDVTRYDKTATSPTLKNAKISYDMPAISYMSVQPNYLLLASLKVMPKQHIGTTYSGSTKIELEQEAWKYEVAAGYKFYLTEDFYIAPALLYGDYYSKLYKIVSSTMHEDKSRDADLRFYGLIGYKLAKTTMMLVTVELDNDILSDSYSDDYSQYPVNITVFQFLSKEWFAYLKYQRTLRDKEERIDATGNYDNIAYGFGIGMKF